MQPCASPADHQVRFAWRPFAHCSSAPWPRSPTRRAEWDDDVVDYPSNHRVRNVSLVPMAEPVVEYVRGTTGGFALRDIELEGPAMRLVDEAHLGALATIDVDDLAAEDGERGMLASDLLSRIREVVNP